MGRAKVKEVKRMAKKYKDDDGMYLALVDKGDRWTFGWYSDEEGYATCEVNDILDDPEYTSDTAPVEKTKWESWIVAQVALEHGIDGGSHRGFKIKKDAREAMRAANEALMSGARKPEPAWVAHARAAGWAAPEGWTP
jgi:hypothetical protein